MEYSENRQSGLTGVDGVPAKTLCTIVCAFLLAAGCHRIGVGEIRDKRPKPGTAMKVTIQLETVLDRGVIESRIQSLSDDVERIEEIRSECREMSCSPSLADAVERAMAGMEAQIRQYESLLSFCDRIGTSANAARRSKFAERVVESALKQCIEAESGMSSLLLSGVEEDAAYEGAVVNALERVEDGLRVGDSRSVIEGYDDLASRLPDQLIPRQYKVAYGLALIRAGEFERAVDTLWGILTEGSGHETVIRLQYEVADRFAERDDLFQTREVLEGMVEDRERDALEVERAEDLLDATQVDFDDPTLIALSLKALEAERIFRVRGDGGEAEHLCLEILEQSPWARPGIFAGELVEQIREDRRAYIGAAIEEAGRLIDAGDLRSAKALLLEIQKTIYVDPAQQDEIDDLLSFLELKSPGLQIDGTWHRADDAEKLHQARMLADDGQFEEAYEAFSSLADSDYTEQAEAGMERARNLIAYEWRKRASALFLKASSETEPQRRLEGLMGSRDLLLHVLQHYPGSDYEDKIRRNLETVERAIREIDRRVLR
ncbi:hypothetical protein ACFL4G_10740 [Thermodesulfobacteriota bacterium]